MADGIPAGIGCIACAGVGEVNVGDDLDRGLAYSVGTAIAGDVPHSDLVTGVRPERGA
jgi:hypothetical protein